MQQCQPGTELKLLLQSIGIDRPWCERCNGLTATMDANGPEWCRQNADRIAQRLREASQAAGMAVTLRTAWNAAVAGVWPHPLHPFRSLVLRAVAEAERKAESGDRK